jgi:drug/metabolite transporter (DMT)-like permease
MDADRVLPPEPPAPPIRSRIGDILYGNAFLLLALASLFWSGNHIVGRALAGHVPPLGIAFIRLSVSTLVLWPFARVHLARDWPLAQRHLGALLWLSLTGGALFASLQYVGLQYTTALNMSVLNSLGPVLIVSSSALAFGDRLSILQICGIAMSLAGVLAIVTRGELQALSALQFNRGDVLIVLAMLGWAVYSASLRLRPRIHWLSFTFLFSALSALATLPFSAFEIWSGAAFQPTLPTLAALAYVAVAPSILAMVAWNRGVELIGANRAGVFLHLIPLYSAVLASAFLGEVLMAYHVAGFVMILVGVWFAGRRA